ncbi:hypothetical protein BC941DRAFT_443972, partial [Chlamydoabsidia padenii]
MFTVSLAPTSTPSRWYSKPLGIQEEYEELAFLEAKFVHEREQALEVHCPMVYPSASNNNSQEDHSLEDIGTQDDINDSGILPATGMGGTTMDDETPLDPYHTPGQQDLLQYLQQGQSTATNGPSRTAHRYSTPNNSYSTPLPHFYTTPINQQQQQQQPDSPDLVSYLSPPPAGRSLRQYMDDSSRGFMDTADMMTHLDDLEEDNASFVDTDPASDDMQIEQPIQGIEDEEEEDNPFFSHNQLQRDMDNISFSSPATRRSTFF